MKTELIDVDRLGIEAGAAKLINHAAELGASDLFFTSNEQHIAVSVRHLGLIRPISIVSLEQGRRFLSHIKAQAGMDLGEKRRPLDGRWIYEKDDLVIDLRISVIPTLYGEDFAIRLLERGTRLYLLENLGMTGPQIDAYQQMIQSPGGLILITGPTGAGKTATLYASLLRLNNGRRKINTIEDPVEFAIEGLRQSQVNPAIELGWAELLKGILRQSPDVIMLGEIRDGETAQTAVHAANSGILVFATLHAPAASGAAQSMCSLGVHPHFLSTALRGVVSQRLVRTLCPQCKKSFDLSDAPHTFDELAPWLAPGEGKALYAAQGCEACHQSGYGGREGVFEVMPITADLRGLIADGRPTREIRQKALEQKMLDLGKTAMLKVARGITSTEEVFRVIPAEHLLDE